MSDRSRSLSLLQPLTLAVRRSTTRAAQQQHKAAFLENAVQSCCEAFIRCARCSMISSLLRVIPLCLTSFARAMSVDKWSQEGAANSNRAAACQVHAARAVAV